MAPFTLPAIKNTTDYLQTRELVLYWLRRPGYSTARSDSALITDSRNALASQFWEGQIRTALKDGGDTRFLFENTGSTYYDKGFEKPFRSSKTTTAIHPSPTRSPLCSPYSTTHRVTSRGSTSFAHASRGIFRSSLTHRSRSLRFSRPCSSCVPFTQATRVFLISLPPSTRIFLQRLSI